MSEFHDLSGEKGTQLLILTDQKGNSVGFASREDCHKKNGKTHLAFMAFIMDKKGKIIIAKRSKSKSLWPLIWDASVVSHVLPQETVELAANRRGKEEMGVDVKFKDIGAFYYFAKFKNDCENEFCHVLTGTAEKEADYNPVEIENIRKLTFPELKKEIKNNPENFTPWLKLAVEKIKLQDI